MGNIKLEDKKIPINLFFRRGFKHCVGADCKKRVEQYIAKTGGFDISSFVKEFNVFSAASQLYNSKTDIEKYNEEGVKKPLFIKEIAYVYDRHMPYYIYKKHEELSGRTPKPIKSFSYGLFQKDKFPESSGLYESKTDGIEIAKEIEAYVKKQDEPHKDAHMPTNAPAKAERKIADPDPKWESIGNFIALLNHYGEGGILRLMEHFHYSEENFAIMAGDEKYLKLTNPELLNPYTLHTSDRDGRSLMAYYRSNVSNWLFEDIFMSNINGYGNGVSVQLSGVDRMREIIIKEKITNAADFAASYHGKMLPLELCLSHTGMAYADNTISFRNNKRMNLLSEHAVLASMETFFNPRERYMKKIDRNKVSIRCCLLYGDRLCGFHHRSIPGFHNKTGDWLWTVRSDWKTFDEFMEDLKKLILIYGKESV